MKIFIFGGTFDPVHEGHLGVIGEVKSACDVLIIAPTKRNPWKQASGASFEQRIEMLEIVLQYEKIEYSRELENQGIVISEYEYNYAKELIDWLRAEIKEDDLEIVWVVGPDIATEVSKWKDWDSLNVGVHVAKNYAKDLHSTEVREGEKSCHSALKSYLSKNNLYR